MLVCIALMMAALSKAQIGTWKTYLAYHDATEAQQAGNLIYVLASNNLYVYNTNDESIQTYDKMNFLNDATINHIAWCQAAKRLLIIYTNNNIDLLDRDNNVTNLSDYYTKSTTLDKTVNSIYVEGIYAYLSTGFGIVKVNVRDAEISDTYNLGFSVTNSYIKDGKIYANSRKNGLYEGNLTDNLLDKNNWTRTGNFQGYSQQIDSEILEIINRLAPGGPKYNYFTFMTMHNDNLYSTGGYFRGGVGLSRVGTIQMLDKDRQWTIFEDNLEEKTGIKYFDISGIAIDPKNESHTIAFGRTGVYEFNDGKYLKEWDIDNSPLQYALGIKNPSSFKNYTIVTTGQFDENGRFWCLNSQTNDGKSALLCLDGDIWTSYPHEELITKDNSLKANRSLGSMENMLFDQQGRMWFVNNHWDVPSFYSYDTDADQLKSYKTIINEDEKKLDNKYVRCLREDKEGNLWVGTDAGPVYLTPEAKDEETSTVRFTQVKVPRNDGTNLADYLLSGVDIQCIGIDGGNRKWFGTGGNGIYLISSDNLEQIAHFTAENSNLLSNTIESIAIDDETGEVFIGTDKGLCSYMSDATATNQEMTKDNVWAYPNPIQPGYNGLITITGLTYNAWIKITTANGTIVNEGRSNGGTYTWDGCDQQGRSVASGIYMVITATEDQEKGVVCKVAIVR